MLNEKYLLYVLVTVFGLLLAGQLIAQLYTVKQLHKVSGKVTSKEIKMTGYTNEKPAKRQYSLLLTLDNQIFGTDYYTVDLDNSNRNIDDQIAVNDNVTIYYPTKAYNLFSLDCLDFGSRVSQVEKDGQVLSSFRDQQNSLWTLTLLLFMAVGVFSYKFYLLQSSDEQD